MKPLVITESISAIEEDCIKRAFKNNVVLTTISTAVEIRDILEKENPERKIYYIGTNCQIVMVVVPFTVLYPNFKIIRDTSNFDCLFSKVDQMKKLDEVYPEIVPPKMYLDETKIIEPGIEDTKFDCSSDMAIVEKIEIFKVWSFLGYAKNGRIISKKIGNLEGDYADPDAKFIPIPRTTDESKKLQTIVTEIVSKFNLTGLFEVIMLEDGNDDLWYYEMRAKPTKRLADFMERAYITFISGQISV